MNRLSFGFASVAIGLILLIGGLLLSACRPGDESSEPLAVFYAASLEGPMERWAGMFREQTGIEVRHEASGSQVAARKVSELGRNGDVVVTADYRIVDWLLVPEFARWQILFAANEMVIAHSEQSRYSAELTANNWREILTRDDVRVGLADKNLAPIGYRTLIVWNLSDIEAGVATTDTERSVAAQLRERIPPALVKPDVNDLAGLLGTQVDYVFLYRSIAHEHNLKYVRLPASVNLSDPERADDYALASVAIEKSTRGEESETIEIHGEPILYGLTIPTPAAHPEAAAQFVRMILGDEGREVLEATGFALVVPPLARNRDAVPESLKPLVRAWNEDTQD